MPFNKKELSDTIKEAYDIAAKGLRSCYTEEGILAGKKNFVDFWARDSFWASFGALVLGDLEQVKININLFLRWQKESGQIPYRTISINQFFKYLHIKIRFKKPIPNYNSILGSAVLDQNLLLPIIIEEYFKKSGDDEYLKDIFPNLELSYLWLKKQDSDSDKLLKEGFLCNWMDHLMKHGKVLINNILYAKSLQSLSNIAKIIGNREQKERFENQSEMVKKKIREKFWDTAFFIDWIDFKRHFYFDTSANLLSVIWDIADPKEAESIINFAKEKAESGVLVKANFPRYHPALVSPQLYLAFLPDYGSFRIWIAALYAIALAKVKKEDEAKKVIENIAKIIVKNKAVFELYNKNGTPANRWFLYTNEVPFTWSAGIFIYAVYYIFQNPQL